MPRRRYCRTCKGFPCVCSKLALEGQSRDTRQPRPRSSSIRGTLGQLLGLANKLGQDELAVLIAVAKRLVAGRHDYGELDLAADERDWTAEAADEALDGAIYLACRLLGEQQGET